MSGWIFSYLKEETNLYCVLKLNVDINLDNGGFNLNYSILLFEFN